MLAHKYYKFALSVHTSARFNHTVCENESQSWYYVQSSFAFNEFYSRTHLAIYIHRTYTMGMEMKTITDGQQKENEHYLQRVYLLWFIFEIKCRLVFGKAIKVELDCICTALIKPERFNDPFCCCYRFSLMNAVHKLTVVAVCVCVI